MRPPRSIRGGRAGMRPAQAMVETVIAVIVVTSLFLVLFKLSYMLAGKILVEHAAMRVARARSVGMNEFMCRKAARVAVIPVAGERLWPVGENVIDWPMEHSRLSSYMESENEARARGILEYEGWKRLVVKPGDGRKSKVTLGFSLFDGEDTFRLDGEAGIEPNATLYMMDGGM